MSAVQDSTPSSGAPQVRPDGPLSKVQSWDEKCGDIQGMEIAGTAQPGYSHIYRSRYRPVVEANVSSYSVFTDSAQRVPHADFVGSRPWDFTTGDWAPAFRWYTYGQTEEIRTALGSAFMTLARQGKLGSDVPDRDWCVAFWTINRPEFQFMHQACNAYGLRCVSIYDNYDSDNAAYILDHSETRIILTTSSHLAAIIAKAKEMPRLKAVVLLDQKISTPSPQGAVPRVLPPGCIELPALAHSWAKEKGIDVYSMEDLLVLGRKNLVAHSPHTSEKDVMMLCYTSGTTGRPKAAQIGAKQLAWSSKAVDMNNEPGTLAGYLPVAHIYECLLETVVGEAGGRIGHTTGDPLRLVEDCSLMKPTDFPSVPRVLNRLAFLIEQQTQGDSFKAKLVRRALTSKLANFDADGTVTHAFWDRLVFNKVKALLGGQVRFFLSGSAPLRPEVARVLRVAFGADVRDGYGSTESGGVSTCMRPCDPKLGSVGPPAPGIELRLKDCPELKYFSTDQPWPRGELLQRGPNNFLGYFKDEKKTKETIDQDGWLHTGDVASIDHLGKIHIVDRVKNLVKLSQGEYVAIENVEQTYLGVPYLAQFWLYGDSFQDYLVGVAVPEPEPFARLASEITGQSITTAPADLQKACENPQVVRRVLLDLVRLGHSRQLNGVEMIRGLHLTPTMFSLENNLLTPTFKMKRVEAKQYFAKPIEALYAKGPEDVAEARR